MADESESFEEIMREHHSREMQLIDNVGPKGVKRMLDLVGDFSEEFHDEWSRIRKRHHNPSQKGDAFENTLKEYLEIYFSSVFEFRTGPALIDSQLRCFSELDGGANEFDVVASFNTAVPNVVFEEAGMEWVLYAGVSFLCEVKSSLNKSALEHDLKKLQTLADLRSDPSDRFGVSARGKASVNHQLHCLVYDETEINKRTRDELLDEYPDAWDLLLIVDEDTLLINSTLPLSHHLFGNDNDNQTFTWCHIENGLLWFVLSLTISIPRPVSVSTAEPIMEMATFMGTSTGGGRFKQDPE
ncbi:MAG TPA: DUF6602 domain-containing protein [Halococcus sp.]|nr:DUF6602 domain-containing protein [Halococcus sp.]